MDQLTFTCPVCGAEVLRGAKACPDCGACEKSGWSENRYLDGLQLPGEDFGYGDFGTRQLGGGARKAKVQWFWVAVAILIVISMAWMTLRGMW